MDNDVREPSTEEQGDENLVPFDERDKPKGANFSNLDDLSFWQLLRRFFFMTPAERRATLQWRIAHLNDALDYEPEAAVTYLLRGEVHLEAGHREDAKRDFQQALTLAQAQLQEERFGLAAQAIQDKATYYLQLLI